MALMLLRPKRELLRHKSYKVTSAPEKVYLLRPVGDKVTSAQASVKSLRSEYNLELGRS
ncbi:hypothetical protein HYC85_028524 [Camellia sinensis]|uniref:Uncharacterized protein n=1 Tax=Camellia sinensis TaxID=4442 RepID=A0A7J7FVE5_CAMSI|nr:hypothetical protein HYC85_028524 [Camellia sinensis]